VSQAVVLNTRPKDQAAELSRLLVEAGFEVVDAPAIDIVPAWDAAELGAVRLALLNGDFDWVVLPSVNAGRDLVAELRSTRVACGVATARALAIRAEVKLERFSAAYALKALEPVLRRGQRVLVPRAAEGREEMLRGLRALGADVAAPVAYRTVSTGAASDALRAGNVDVVTLCSPSAVTSIVGGSGAQRLDATRVVCLGETTAAAARDAGLPVHAVAQTSTMSSLVSAVQTALGRREAVA
jgi:uroporphyrinogen-III synthase